MSALLQRVPFRDASGLIKLADGVAAPFVVHNGLPYELSGDLSVDIGGGVDHYHQGLPFTANGRIAVGNNTAVTRFGMGAAPFDAAGRLVISGAAASYASSGVYYTAASRVAGS